MRIVKAANRYAKSLIELSIEQGKIEEVYEDMQAVAKTVSESGDLQSMLKSPVIKPDTKASILDKIFSGNVSDLSLRFIKLIAEKGRESYLEGIAEGFILQYKAFKNINQAEVTSASPLDGESKAKIEAMLQTLAPGVTELKETINPELIGGYILKVGDQMIDASVNTQLRELRREFTENS